MENKNFEELNNQVTELLVDLFRQESVADEEKFLVRKGIAVPIEDLKKFHEAKENIRLLANKKLTEAEMASVNGGGLWLDTAINAVVTFVVNALFPSLRGVVDWQYIDALAAAIKATLIKATLIKAGNVGVGSAINFLKNNPFDGIGEEISHNIEFSELDFSDLYS